MCGIVGWLSTSSNQPVERDTLIRMRDSMVHRGPDGEGIWVSPARDVGLGFRRLAIIDLSAAANQPMANEDGGVQVVFNGEIYNHVSLRQELEARGHTFKTDHSDTETIVHGYEEWGASVVEHLEGMFAIGIWDQARRRLFVARDRIGIKPLYFSWLPGAFVFASEIKALTLHPGLRKDLEPVAVFHYLSFLATPAPLTMFRNVFKLPAGYRAIVEADGRMQAERYWDALPRPAETLPERDRLSGPELRELAVRRTRELLERSVRKRLMSDVPFGVLLSGGIDSSANVALMAQQMDRPVRTFTVGFSDHEHLNELRYARRVAEHFGTDHHEVLVDEKAMREYLPRLVHSQDEPIADWVCIPLYFVSKLVRESGTTVVQVGEGSDEQFCGYRSYMAYLHMYERYWRPYVRLPREARSLLGAMARGLTRFSDRYDAYLDVIVRAGLDREPFWSGAHALPESRKHRVVDTRRLNALDVPSEMSRSGMLPASFAEADTYGVVRAFFEDLDRMAPGSDILTRMTFSEFRLRLPELLLMRVDKIGMSVSIEPRVPFLDHELVELTMSLPMETKLAGGGAKALLKQAVRGLLPDDVIDRPKMGFGAPMAEWLRGEFGVAVRAQLVATRFFDCFPADRGVVLGMLDRHRSGRANLPLYVWAFYNAVAWFDHWIDGSDAGRGA